MNERTPLFGATPTTAQNSSEQPVGVLEVRKREYQPMDNFGMPIGQETARIAKTIERPIGVTYQQWITAIEIAVEHFRLTSGVIEPNQERLQGLSGDTLPAEIWDRIYQEDNVGRFQTALALKGILKKGAGLTHEQLRALRYLTDITNGSNLQRRLRTLGISWEVFQNWQRDPKFNEQFKALSEDVLNQAEPIVAVELAKGAIQGKLDFIKYLHQLTGRFDGAVTTADMKAFVSGVVEILQEHIKDQALLKAIGTDLVRLKKATLESGKNPNG